MKIVSSEVAMAGSSYVKREESKQEMLEYWNKDVRVKVENGEASYIKTLEQEANSDKLEISEYARKLLEEEKAKKCEECEKSEKSEKIEMDELSKMKLEVLRKLLEAITGKKIKDTTVEIEIKNCDEVEELGEKLEAAKNSISSEAAPAQPQRKGWGVIYRYSEITSEKEVAGFNSSGIVKTADGRDIAFNVNFNLTRESISGKSIEFKAGDALIDPLVIAYNGIVPSLGNEKIEFDIDADGIKDFVNFTGTGSGFLALDKNENGVIDDGSELFGPQTGSGFGELKEYDSDGNNWIDENDEVFSKLKIWTTGADGQKTLLAIAEVGVGAIYLGSATTKFEMQDSSGAEIGAMQRSGVYLKESGEAGVISHIDLKK